MLSLSLSFVEALMLLVVDSLRGCCRSFLLFPSSSLLMKSKQQIDFLDFVVFEVALFAFLLFYL